MVFSCFKDLIDYVAGCLCKSSFPINDLPSEILLEILYKLPADQLHQNQDVCKLWSSLISNPSFRSQFLLRRNPPISPAFTLFVTYKGWDDAVFHTQTITKDGKTFFNQNKDSLKFLAGVGWRVNDRVHSSSSGLILCCRTNFLGKDLIYYVCNPTTKQWITLPSPPSCKRFELSGLVVCNLSSEIPNSETTRFKVVRLFTCLFETDGGESGLEIFDSATNRWEVFKMKHNFWWHGVFNIDINGTEHKGILYWENRESNIVIAFDPKVNKCYKFPLPGSSNDNVHHRLDVSGNDLYYTELDYRSEQNNPSTIWMFDEFEGKPTWIVHHRFDFRDWTLQISESGHKAGTDDHIDPRESTKYQKVLGIDPSDCNILYVSLRLHHVFNKDYERWIYSLDTRRRKMKKLCSIRYNGWSLMFVQPSWPTTIPNMPKYEDTHRSMVVCGYCRKVHK